MKERTDTNKFGYSSNNIVTCIIINFTLHLSIIERATVRRKNMKKTTNKVYNIVLMAILTALVAVLQVVGGIPIGPVSITLTLIPIVVGAILLGPAYGTVLGLVFGLVVAIMSLTGRDPGGQMVFAANPVLAWLLCLLKGAAAGFLPAIVYKFFSNRKSAPQILMAVSGAFIFLGGFAVSRNLIGAGMVKTIVTCVILALIAAGYMVIVHFALRGDNAAFYLSSMIAPIANTAIFIAGILIFFRPVLAVWAGETDTLVYVITGLCGINFLVEFAIAIIFAPTVALIVKNAKKVS